MDGKNTIGVLLQPPTLNNPKIHLTNTLIPQSSTNSFSTPILTLHLWTLSQTGPLVNAGIFIGIADLLL